MKLDQDQQSIDAWIAACLRSETWAYQTVPDGINTAALVNRIAYQGVVGCFLENLDLMKCLPKSLADALRDVARGHAFWELAHRKALLEFAAMLEQKSIPALVMKGTALAYSYYTQPANRPRGDTDILISQNNLEAVDLILHALGYKPWVAVVGTILTSECAYSRIDQYGFTHTIDLHWRISNRLTLSAPFPIEEQFSRAIPFQALTPQLLILPAPDSLLIASFNRHLHSNVSINVDGREHNSQNRLIWLMDIAILAKQLSETQWQEFVSSAKDKGFGYACYQSLNVAQDLLSAKIPDWVMSELQSAPSTDRPSRYLMANRIVQYGLDFQSTRSFSEKLQYLKEMLLPSESYMRTNFQSGERQAWLIELHIKRVFQGLRQHLKKAGKRL